MTKWGVKNVVDKIFDKNEKERKCHFIFTDKREKEGKAMTKPHDRNKKNKEQEQN